MADMVINRLVIVFGGLILLLGAGCKDDLCKEMEPAFEVELDVGSLDATKIKTLKVDISSGSKKTQKTYTITNELSDGKTSFAVTMGEAYKAGFTVTVSVIALDGKNVLLGSASKSFRGFGNACNWFELELGASIKEAGADGPLADAGDAAVKDAGPDAVDAKVDVADAATPDAPKPVPCTALGTVCSSDKWCWENPKWGGADINAMWTASSSLDVFGVGDLGTIRHYDGKAWSNVKQTITTKDLYGVWGTGITNLYVAGDGGTVLRRDATGWKKLTTGYANDLQAVWGSSASDVYFVGTSGIILRYDGKTTWSKHTSGTAVQLEGVWGSNATDIYVVGEKGTVLRYYGGSWMKETVKSSTSTTGSDLHAVWGSSANNVFVVGDNGSVFRNDGAMWDDMTKLTGTAKDLLGVWGTGANNVFVVGAEGKTMRWDGGTAWKGVASNATTDLNDVRVSSTISALAVGAVGTVLRYSKPGSTGKWTPETNMFPNTIYGMWGTGVSDIYAVAAKGAVLHNNGGGWAAKQQLSGYPLSAVWGTSSTSVYATSWLGQVYRSALPTWVVDTGGGKQLFGLWGSGPSDIYAVGAEGLVLRYNQKKWGVLFPANATDKKQHGVWGSSASNIYIVGEKGFVRHFTGGKWITRKGFIPTDHYFDVWGSGASDVFIVGSGCKVNRFTKKGWTIDAIGCGQYLYDVWGSGPTNVYAVGGKGAVRRYQGSTWAKHEARTTAGLHHVWGPGPNNVYAAGAGGAILHRCGP